VTADRLRPANIARGVGAVASRAADVERRADRATRTPPGSPARGEALIAVDDAASDAWLALFAVVADAAVELRKHPLGVRAHAASEAVHEAGTLYVDALLARARAWGTP
jgi:hypothetical protein